MKRTLGFLMLAASVNVFAVETPGLKEACAKGCTAEMKAIHSDFLKASKAPSVNPAVYSGQCYILSAEVKADSNHFSTILIDKNEQGAFLTGVSSHYTDGNEYALSSYQDFKETMAIFNHRVGKTTGQQLTVDATSASFVSYKDWQLTAGTWIKQDSATKDLLVINYKKNNGRSDGWTETEGAPATEFCRLTLNPNGQAQ